MRYLLTNSIDHDAVHPSHGGRSNSLAPSRPFGHRTPQRLTQHAWPSVDGLALAQHHPCSRRHATPCTWMELARSSHSPDSHDKTIGACVLSSTFDRRPIGCLNRSTGQMLLRVDRVYIYVNKMSNLQQPPLLLH